MTDGKKEEGTQGERGDKEGGKRGRMMRVRRNDG
jgi:hypothetical protein